MTLTLEVFLRSKLCVIFGGQSNAVKAQCPIYRSNSWVNMKEITRMHFEQISCFGDIYLDLVGILGIDDISTGRNIHIWT